jgi:uncharacterized protein (DUF433 family)
MYNVVGDLIMSRRKVKTGSGTKNVVSRSPKRLSGQAVFAGTRVPVKTLFDYLAAGDSLERFLDHFPDVTHEQAAAVIEQAGAELTANAK